MGSGLLFLLLVSSCLSHTTFLSNLAQGRAIPRDHLVKAPSPQPQLGKGGVLVVEASSVVIGSTPPRCDRWWCSSCGRAGRCEAVQVPVVPKMTSSHHSYDTSAYSTRGDDFSNYKPMSWKCKCGNFLFNP